MSDATATATAVPHLPTAPMAEAVIFDHDGILVDSIRPDFLACSALFEEHGATLPARIWAQEVCGRPDGYPRLFDILLDTANSPASSGAPDSPGPASSPGPGDSDPRAHAALKERLSQLWERFMTPEHIRLLPGVRDLLEQLRAAGLPVAVASAADTQWVRRWLDHFGIEEFFDTVVGGDEVPRRKPDPAVYLEASARLGVPASRCVAFEDSLTGVTAAKAAGITVTAVPTELTRSLDYSAADHVLPGLWAVDLGRLGPSAGTP
ncbi:HAD-IA family hydrolase [Streptomyces sp. NPDC041068]|uniref:HAD family hydrolase n=1 Tax=Streptomyces sp. NPDC041068 TaxID=3155130 RepID=UPI0033E7C01E